MYPYRKSQLDIFYGLVLESNPSITLPINAVTVKLSKITAQPVVAPSIANTNVTITAKDDTWAGFKVVQYRRIDVQNMFKGATPIEISLWSAGATVTAAEVFEEINRKYGTNFSAASDSNWTDSTALNINAVATWVVNANSLNYIGSIDINIKFGKRRLDFLLRDTVLAARTYAGGNSFPVGRKPQGQYISYDLDFSTIFTRDYTNTAIGASTAPMINATSLWKANGYSDLDNTVSATIFGGLAGCTFLTVALPSALYPEANSDKYNHLVVISPPATGDCWFQGKIFCHTNY